jgi:VIT1/CCC1 family predicted Fe2+/Mn2+ transporter
MGFGLASATITTLGLMIGLESSTSSRIAVLGGIITIAIADAFSDALGVHIAKESEGNFTHHEVWQATLATFFFKAFFAGTFLIPVLLLPLQPALLVSIVWGAVILFFQSYNLARSSAKKIWPIISEHLLIAAVVIISTHYLGHLLAIYLK